MDEDAAYVAFKKLRWPDTEGAPTCPRCSSVEAYEVTGKRRHRCKSCRHEYSVTSGTIFHSRKLDFKSLLVAIYLFADPAKGVAALRLCHDLGVQYKTAFVLAHKVREAMMLEQRNMKLEGEVEIDGSYYGGHVKPANKKKDRLDRRTLEVRTGKRQCVVGVRERGDGGRTRVVVVPHERDAVTFIHDVVDRMSSVNADEAGSWDDLHGIFSMCRINHSVQFSDDGVCTNQMESLFSRLRRLEVGTHHHIAGPYLLAYASEAAWREDHRRAANGKKVDMLVSATMASKQSPIWKGYWQRRKGDERVDDPWIHFRDDPLASLES